MAVSVATCNLDIMFLNLDALGENNVRVQLAVSCIWDWVSSHGNTVIMSGISQRCWLVQYNMVYLL